LYLRKFYICCVNKTLADSVRQRHSGQFAT